MDSLVASLRKNSCPGPGAACRSDPIELSNACRAFYQSRLESARALRERWGPSGSPAATSGPGSPGDVAASRGDKSDWNENCRKKSSIDVAMETLRREMASLMEQDLSLMKQLLTLNEEIEELKWRRRYCWSRTSSSLMTSSGDVDLGSLTSFTSSEASLSWWRGESGDLLTKYPGISSLSLHTDHNRLSVYDEEDPMGTFNRRAATPRSRGSQRTLTVPGPEAAAQGHHHHHHHHHHHLHHHHHQQQHQHQQYHQQQQQTSPSQHPQQVPSTSSPGAVQTEDKVDKSFAERESFDSGIHEGYTTEQPPPPARADSGSADVTRL